MLKHTQDVVVDDFVGSTAPGEAAPREDTGRSLRSGVPLSSAAVDVQLQRVEARLIDLAGADPELERDVHLYLRESCARFATARVRQFVPILVEREVRARLRARDLLLAEDRTG
jgi:hypothetical protein